MIRGFLRSLVALSIVCLAACSDSATEPSRPQSERRFTLTVGESVTLDPSVLVIGFERITEDSRCPVDVICIQAGEARGSFYAFIGMGAPPVSFELSTLQPRSVEIGGYRIALDTVSPAPRSNARIDPREYRAELVVSR